MRVTRCIVTHKYFKKNAKKYYLGKVYGPSACLSYFLGGGRGFKIFKSETE